jgi:hypothetical protein
MLPASDLTAILANLSTLHLEPNTAAQILAAVLAPLLRSSELEPPTLPSKRAERPQRRPRRAARSKPRRAARRKRNYKRHDARDRALAALRVNPDATPTEIAKIVKVSRATAVHAREELAKEQRRAARKEARKQARKMAVRATPDRRQRAQRFLKDKLADGPQRVSDLEEAAEKAHVDPTALEQARADLGIVTSRSNAGGVQAVQWSLPG